jgi:nucleotide-binding universal stress UspA family protein
MATEPIADNSQERPVGVLVPLDGSKRAERALRYAQALPNRYLRLVSVEPIELSAVKERMANDDPSPWGEWPVDDARAYLELIATFFRNRGWEVEPILTNGDPGPRIVDAARTSELIVMSTRGHGLTRHLLGTTADYVLEHSAAPALLVRDDLASVYAFLRVVVPLDGSEQGEEAVPLGAMLCTGLGADLYLVEVVDPSTSIRTVEELRAESNAYLDVQKFRLSETPVRVSTEVRIGDHVESLLDVSRPGDLILMATRGHDRLHRIFLGYVSTAFVDRSPVPVALLRADLRGTPRKFDRAMERYFASAAE